MFRLASLVEKLIVLRTKEYIHIYDMSSGIAFTELLFVFSFFLSSSKSKNFSISFFYLFFNYYSEMSDSRQFLVIATRLDPSCRSCNLANVVRLHYHTTSCQPQPNSNPTSAIPAFKYNNIHTLTPGFSYVNCCPGSQNATTAALRDFADAAWRGRSQLAPSSAERF